MQDISWDDREPFRAGLTTGQEAVLDELPGATVYHLAIDITDPHQLVGEMEARYTNQESVTLDELVLHLFPQHLGGDLAVSDVRVDGRSVASAIEDGILRVYLDQPLQPGEQTVLSLSFVTTVPGEESTKYKVLAYADDILALAHFYPMFAVFDDEGWHTLPSPDHGDETFSDMSFYLVDVFSPADQVLVASGVAISGEGDPSHKRTRFAAGPMRDFYLVASNRFEEIQQQVGSITVNSYAPAELMDAARLALDTTAFAVESYGERYGPYPYAELDVVSTPTDALGIEYPGVFANAIRIYDLQDGTSSTLPNSVLIESTSAHEAAHQWFYGLVGSDQLGEPWLDESLTQYATWRYYVDRYGERNAQPFADSLQGRWDRAGNPDMPIGLPAADYNGQDYSAIIYGRGPLFLDELADQMGQEVFDTFLRDYSEQYRWRIATAADFMALAEAHCNCDLSQLFEENVFGR